MISKFFKYFLTSFILVYITFVLLVYFNQEKLVFHPSPNFRMPPKSFEIEQKFIHKTNGDSLMTWWKQNNDSGDTFLFFSGNAGNISGRLFFVEMAQSLGMNILLFDYRGFGLSSGKLQNKEDLFEDSRAVINFLIKDKNIPQEKIVLWALSLGGTIAANLATEYSVKALIFEGVMKSIKDVALESNSFRYKILPLDLILKFDYNTVESVKHLDEPILFLHSKADSLVRYHHAETLYSLVKNSSKEIIPLTGSHQTAHDDSYDIYFEGIRSFLNRLK